ncbi:MAG TPA: helix-turn-helix domain-containing protein [Spirochaetales bacterium]|nr:helix-turn-helix domain-containing protein [Spirochaetales bacterium]
MKEKEHRIGLVLISGESNASLRFCSSIGRLAKRSGVTLFVFAGGMPTKEQVQGSDFTSILLFADPLLVEESESFDLSLFGPIPCVAVNFTPMGLPSIQCNLYLGAKKLLQHYLEGRNRIACIQGPANNRLAQQSFQAYRDALAENNLPLDFTLVTDIGLNELLDHRALVPGIDFTLLYCFDDEQAFCLGLELEKRGFSTPILVGAARGGSPFPSVVIPVSQMATSAWEAALSGLPGESLFECEISDGEGIFQPDVLNDKSLLLSILAKTYDLDAGDVKTVGECIGEFSELEDSAILRLKEGFSSFLDQGGSLVVLQKLLAGFSLLHEGKESLFIQLLIHVAQHNDSILYKKQTLFSLMRKAMATDAKWEEKVLVEYLPSLGIRSCYIVQQQAKRRLVAGVYRTSLLETARHPSFDTPLLPPALVSQLDGSCWMHFPLGASVGYMLLETSHCQPELSLLLQDLFSPLARTQVDTGSEKSVFAIGEEPAEIASLLSGSRQILLKGRDEFFPALQKGDPSLLIVGILDRAFFSEVRSHKTTSLTPIVLVQDSFSSQDAEEVLLIPNLIMVHRSVASSRAFLVRLTSLVTGEELAVPTMTAALVKGAIVYMDTHVQTSFSRWELAEAVSASEDYLGRIFRREMGLSLWEYLHTHRIAIATGMLKGTHMSITEIAHQTGFKDLAYFSRVFKKITGFSPSQVRS